MIRKFLVVLLVLLPAVPALAKSDPDYYPMSCDVLWTAVKSTLNNPADYNVIMSDDLNFRVSFVVVGNLTVYKDVVILRSKDKGCSIKVNITQVGSDNSNERSFRGRLKRAVARMQSPQPPLAVGGGISTASTSGAPSQPATAPAPVSPAKPQMTPRTGLGAIWASTLTSQIILSHTADSGSDHPRSGAKPATPIPSAGPTGY